MHLEEIVLDGFKSYAVRTTVSGFDREFNAITGLAALRREQDMHELASRVLVIECDKF